MRTFVAVCFAALMGALTVAQAASNAEVQRKGEAWLALLDAQKYSDSWTDSSAYFRSQVKQDRWIQMLQAARDPLGKLTSRKFVSVTFRKSAPGAPDGDYALLRFESSFQHKAKAVETVTLKMDQGQWKTVGYFIK